MVESILIKLFVTAMYVSLCTCLSLLSKTALTEAREGRPYNLVFIFAFLYIQGQMELKTVLVAALGLHDEAKAAPTTSLEW